MKSRHDATSDAELFGLLREQQPVAEAAFGELYRRHSPRVYAYCLRILGSPDEARDVFQETFIRFFQAARTERVMSNVPAYLLRIARNLCLNVRRDTKPSTPVEDFHVAMNDIPYERTEFLQLITMALELLPHEYREAFVLREYDGLSYAEIADVTGESLANVKIRLHRAKEKIRKILTPYLAELT